MCPQTGKLAESAGKLASFQILLIFLLDDYPTIHPRAQGDVASSSVFRYKNDFGGRDWPKVTGSFYSSCIFLVFLQHLSSEIKQVLSALWHTGSTCRLEDGWHLVFNSDSTNYKGLLRDILDSAFLLSSWNLSELQGTRLWKIASEEIEHPSLGD